MPTTAAPKPVSGVIELQQRATRGFRDRTTAGPDAPHPRRPHTPHSSLKSGYGRTVTLADDEGDVPTGTPFARMEMRGERFDGGRLPITSLIELERYRDLIVAAAKEKWFASNEGSELPADFESSFRLDLVNLHNGSAVSELEVADTAYSEYYVAGREDVEAAFQSIVANEFQPGEYGAWLDREDFWNFGNTLGQTESIVVRERAGAEPRVTILGASRESRFERARESLTVVEQPLAPQVVARTDEGQVAGRLVAINADAKSFRVDTLRFGKINGKYKDEELFADLKSVLDSSSRAPVVRVGGSIKFEGDAVRSIVQATSVELLEIDGEPWSRRFIELANLAPGWLDGESGGQPVVFAAMDAARVVMNRVAVLSLDEPGIFPMEDGGILLEWAELSEVASVEISPDLEFHLFHTRRDERVSESRSTSSMDVVLSFVEGSVPR